MLKNISFISTVLLFVAGIIAIILKPMDLVFMKIGFVVAMITFLPITLKFNIHIISKYGFFAGIIGSIKDFFLIFVLSFKNRRKNRMNFFLTFAWIIYIIGLITILPIIHGSRYIVINEDNRYLAFFGLVLFSSFYFIFNDNVDAIINKEE